MGRGANEGRHRNLLGNRDERQEVMLQHLCEVHSVFRRCNEAFSNEILGLVSNLNVVRERVSDRLNFLVGLFDVLRLERRTTVQHGVENNTD